MLKLKVNFGCFDMFSITVKSFQSNKGHLPHKTKLPGNRYGSPLMSS